MKRLVLAGVGALAMIATLATAHAADMPRQRAMPAKAPMYSAPYSWTGAYIGINGGGGWADTGWTNAAGSSGFNTSGAAVGGTLGVNYQVGHSVFGVEGDIDWTGIRGTSSTGVCTTFGCETRNTWLGTARGRIGYAFGNFLPYVTGGVAFGDVKNNGTGLSADATTRTGWALGGGGEFALAGPWSAKVEYLYVDLGKTTCAAANCGIATEVDFHTNLVRAGLNYRF